MLDRLRRLDRLIGSAWRLQWVALTGLAVLLSGVEALGAVLVLALLQLITGTAVTTALPMLDGLGDWAQRSDEPAVLLWASVVIGAFFLLRGALVFGYAYAQHRAAQHAGVRLSTELLRGYLSVPIEFHAARNSAECIRNVNSTAYEVVRSVLLPVVGMVQAGFVILTLGFVLFVSAPLAALSAGLVLGVAITIVMRTIQPRIKGYGAESQVSQKESLKSVQQALGGQREIKLLRRQRYFEEVFARSRLRFARAQYRRAAFDTLPRLVVEVVLIGVILAFFGLTVLAEGRGDVVLPVLGLFAYTALRLQPAVGTFLGTLNNLRFGAPALELIERELALFRELEEYADDGRAVVVPLPFEHELRLEGVRFRYGNSEADVLSDIDLVLRPGESIGIVGSTGAGKTTLVNLVLGLLFPTGGRVTVDGTELMSDRRARWQANCAVVPQHVFLLDDSLRRNIAFGLEEAEIDDQRVGECVELAQLQDVVRALPQGLDTPLGEHGIRLSGGQRQRVAIARALYTAPAVLVFDEGTAALDAQTELELLRALRQLRGRHTIIAVAHRLATVRDADRIVLLNAGRIADVGTFESLIERSAEFRELAR